MTTVGLNVAFGGVVANEDVSISVARGTLVGLIGANGAGKTTFIDAVTGYVPSTGSVQLDGNDISGLPPHARVRSGLVRTFQSLELLEDLTVAENLLLACERPRWHDLLTDFVVPLRRSARTITKVEESLERLDVARLRDRFPADLSHGQRKKVSIARALAASPQLLLLDEPAAGLDSHESLELGHTLQQLAADGLGMLLVDHDMGLVMGCCEFVYVLDFGRVIAEGTPTEVQRNPLVLRAYLGSPSADHEAVSGSEVR
jgi:branched-chain amino acid transport system ATP-binding protein